MALESGEVFTADVNGKPMELRVLSMRQKREVLKCVNTLASMKKEGQENIDAEKLWDMLETCAGYCIGDRDKASDFSEPQAMAVMMAAIKGASLSEDERKKLEPQP